MDNARCFTDDVVRLLAVASGDVVKGIYTEMSILCKTDSVGLATLWTCKWRLASVGV